MAANGVPKKLKKKLAGKIPPSQEARDAILREAADYNAGLSAPSYELQALVTNFVLRAQAADLAARIV